MTDKENQELEARRKESALKTMYYTRYFSVRYATAAFFFVNLYWTLMLHLSNARLAMMLPMAVALFAALAMWEQTRMYTINQREAKLTKLFYGISLSLNVLLILLVLLNRFSLLYPFFTASSATQVFLILILSVGILLNLLMLVKLNRISHRADKQYQRIQKYMASLQ